MFITLQLKKEKKVVCHSNFHRTEGNIPNLNIGRKKMKKPQ